MHIWSILERAARLYPHRTAVIAQGERRTYRELREESAAFAAALRARGVVPGDRIAVLAWNGLSFIEAYFGAAGLGAVLTPLNARLSAPEVAAILRDCGARWILAEAGEGEILRGAVAAGTGLEGAVWIGASPGMVAGIANLAWSDLVTRLSPDFAPARVDSSDLAHLYYTSGTTGRPKGVMLSHRNVCVHALAAIAELALEERDVWAHIAPMFHLADAWATFAITWVGGTHVMLPRFEARAALDLIERERITITNLVPTMLNFMVAHPSARGRDFRSLRCVLSGGAPIAPTLVRAIIDTFGCEYVQTYGMTETSPYLTLGKLEQHMLSLPIDARVARQARTGRPFIAVELIVADDAGRPVPADDRTVGEIWVRGDTVTPGYWNAPDETRAAFHDGWLKTGDLAVIDAEGYVNIVDRKKDMILSGGENIYCVEVEHVLQAHPHVLEVAVFGVPDPTWGEAVRAAVVLREPHAIDAAALETHCRRHLAGYKVPRAFDFMSDLPRTGSGKIAKRLLRDQASR